jgi:fructose-1,6-bisphosphatase/inositol monophosphatase family enzyme
VQVLDLIDQGGSEGGAVGRHWVLDPIDGTRGFVGLRQYAICLGMLQDGKVSDLTKLWNACRPSAALGPQAEKLQDGSLLSLPWHAAIYASRRAGSMSSCGGRKQ